LVPPKKIGQTVHKIYPALIDVGREKSFKKKRTEQPLRQEKCRKHGREDEDELTGCGEDGQKCKKSKSCEPAVENGAITRRQSKGGKRPPPAGEDRIRCLTGQHSNPIRKGGRRTSATLKLQRECPIQLAPRQKLRKHVLRLKQPGPNYKGLLADHTTGSGQRKRWATKTGHLVFPIDLSRLVAQQLDVAQRKNEMQDAQQNETDINPREDNVNVN